MVSKQWVLRWAFNTAGDTRTPSLSELRDGAVFLGLLRKVFPVVGGALAEHHRPRPANRVERAHQWRCVGEALEQLRLPRAIFPAASLMAGRDAACTALLACLYFMHAISRRPDHAVSFVFPVPAALSRFLQSTHCIEALARGGAVDEGLAARFREGVARDPLDFSAVPSAALLVDRKAARAQGLNVSSQRPRLRGAQQQQQTNDAVVAGTVQRIAELKLRAKPSGAAAAPRPSRPPSTSPRAAAAPPPAQRSPAPAAARQSPAPSEQQVRKEALRNSMSSLALEILEAEDAGVAEGERERSPAAGGGELSALRQARVLQSKQLEAMAESNYTLQQMVEQLEDRLAVAIEEMASMMRLDKIRGARKAAESLSAQNNGELMGRVRRLEATLREKEATSASLALQLRAEQSAWASSNEKNAALEKQLLEMMELYSKAEEAGRQEERRLHDERRDTTVRQTAEATEASPAAPLLWAAPAGASDSEQECAASEGEEAGAASLEAGRYMGPWDGVLRQKASTRVRMRQEGAIATKRDNDDGSERRVVVLKRRPNRIGRRSGSKHSCSVFGASTKLRRSALVGAVCIELYVPPSAPPRYAASDGKEPPDSPALE